MSTVKSRKLTKFFAGIVVIGMVMLLLPIASLSAEPAPDGWLQIKSPDPGFGTYFTTITVGAGCDIEKIQIKAGNAGVSGEITADGSYGHYVLWDTGNNVPVSPTTYKSDQLYVLQTVVPMPAITEGANEYRWVGAYIVSGLSGIGNIVTVSLVTAYENVCHGLSHIDYLHTCATGSLTIQKVITQAQASDVTFEFNISPEPSAGINPVSITVLAGQTSASSGPITLAANVEYTVTEVGPPSGWVLQSTSNNIVTITQDGQSETAVFTDRPATGSLTIQKVITQAQASDVTFEFNISPEPSAGINPVSITVLAGQTSASSGPIALEYGVEYTVTEVGPPSGWVLQSTSNNIVTIAQDGQSETAVFTDRPDVGSLTIQKVITQAQASDVTFEFNISPEPSAGINPVSITVLAGQTSASSGPIALEYGVEYTVTEVGPPSGWVLQSTSNNIVTIAQDGQSETAVFTDRPATGSLTVEKVITESQASPVTFYFNITPTPTGITNPISITVPAGDTTASYGPIALEYGVEYTVTEVSIPIGWVLKSSSNNVVTITQDGQSETATFTDEIPECSGQIKVIKLVDGSTPTSGTFKFKIKYPNGTEQEYVLDGGSYSKILTLPCDDGYEIWESSVGTGFDFDQILTTIGSVNAGNDHVEFDITGDETGEVDYITIKNEEKLYEVKVTKTTTGIGTDTIFTFNLVGVGVDLTGTVTASDGNPGTVTFSNLKAGSYVITETLPTGYDTWVALVSDPETNGFFAKSIGFTIPADVAEGNTVYVYFHNDPSDKPPTGGVTVLKTDPTGAVLEDAGFSLFYTNGVLAHSEKLTNSSGVVTFGGMPYGDYIVRETTVPPGGYYAAPDQTVTINAGNPVVTVTFVNKRGGGDGDGDGEMTVLAFTGFNMAYYIAGFLLMLIGAIGSIYLTRMLRRKEE